MATGPDWVVATMLAGAEFLSSVGVMILDVNGGSLSLLRTPHRLRSRVAGTYRFVNYGIRPIGALLGGALGTVVGLEAAIWIGAVGALAGVLWLVPSPVPRLRAVTEGA